MIRLIYLESKELGSHILIVPMQLINYAELMIPPMSWFSDQGKYHILLCFRMNDSVVMHSLYGGLLFGNPVNVGISPPSVGLEIK